jgi:TonB family protein
LAFSGRVRSRATYHCELIGGLTFQLLPRENGWQIAVLENERDDNLAGLTPVLNGQSPLSITDSDLRNMLADSNSHDLAERKFIFSPDVGRPVKYSSPEQQIKAVSAAGTGSFKITGIQPAEHQPDLSEISFDVSLKLSAVNGIPVYKVGGDVSPPKPSYTPDPEYSAEARKAKYQGTVVLWMIVGPDGIPRNIRVARSLGLGLDEKAVDTVRAWRFKPAVRNGRAVPVYVNVEVAFRLRR